MSSIQIAGNTSGSITLSAPAIAGSTVLTLQSITGTVALITDGVLPGTIIMWGGATAPTGYLACPTTPTNISRTTYAALFAAIQTSWGAGDGSTTFGMPYYPAGYTGVATTPGTTTVGVNLTHTHATNSGVIAGGGGSLTAGAALGFGNATASTMTPTGGAANLAAGMGILFCVKY